MRTLSETLREAINAQESGEILLVLLTIEHEELEAPLRLCSNPIERLTTDPLVYGCTSRGNEFLYVPFAVTLPDERLRTPPRSRLSLDNVDRRAVRILRSTLTPATLLFEFVLASDLDNPEFVVRDFEVFNASYDGASITIECGIDPLVNEPFPAEGFVPAFTPGLF